MELERIQRCCIPLVWGRAPSPVHAERNSAVAGGYSNYGFALITPTMLQTLARGSPARAGIRDSRSGSFHLDSSVVRTAVV
jgi:hypothetical protein